MPKHSHQNRFFVRPGLPSIRFWRSLCIAILFGTIGFSIPIVIGFAEWIHSYITSPYQNPPGLDCWQIFDSYRTPSIGCALILFLAAILKFIPSNQMSFAWAVVVVSLYAVVPIWIAKFIGDTFFGFYQKSPEPHPWAWIAWALAIVLPVACTIVHTLTRCAKSSESLS